MPNSLLSIPFTVQLQPPPPLKGPQEWRILKRSSYSRCHSFPIYFSQCVFFPPHRCTGQWGKNARKNKTSLIKYLIPQEATQNSERLSPGPHGTQWFQSGARKVLWNHLIQEGSVVPLENEGKFLEWQYICTFFFFLVYLAVAGLRCILQDLVSWLGDRAQAPCIGIAASSSTGPPAKSLYFFLGSSYFH